MRNKGREIRGSKAMHCLECQNKEFMLNVGVQQQLMERIEEWERVFHMIRVVRGVTDFSSRILPRFVVVPV